MSRIFSSRASRDAIVLAALGLFVYLVGLRFDLMDHLVALYTEHEEYELDELILAIFVIGLMGFVYAFRRILDLRAEIRRRQKAEADTTWIAQHDVLTRLPNRRLLDRFATDIGRGPTAGERRVVFMIDLDGFKKVNDLIGHQGGNDLLVEVAGRMQRLFADDLVVRIGGDEFAIVASSSAADDPRAAGGELVEAISQPMILGGIQVQVGASVGIAVYPEDAADLSEVLRLADVALYSAKRRGRSTVSMFEKSMDEALSQRTEAELALRRAIAAKEIVPHYQPLVDLSTGGLRGFEALARWHKADGSTIPPDVFIGLAEDAGLITLLSEQLLMRACRDALTWPSDYTLAFNISPTQLTDHLLGLRIVQILGEAGLPPNRLEIEITESALVRDMEAAVAVVNSLHDAGIGVALDDFGTGYSSLGQLSRLRFDKVKIDRSFIESFEDSDRQEKIVKAIIGLGHGLGIATTAEGIEADHQWQRLRAMGCDFGQGYLFGKALPPEGVLAMIGSRQEKRRASA